MVFINVEDFLTQASAIPSLSSEEEKALAQAMGTGDREARDALIRGYLPLVAAVVKKAPEKIRTLRTVYACIVELEKGADSFSFHQNSEPFVHHLSWRLRQCIVRCIADQD